MCKRKRFGEYETNPRVDDVVFKQCDMWQASFSDQAGGRRVSVRIFYRHPISEPLTTSFLSAMCAVPGKPGQSCEKTQVNFSHSE